MLVVSSLTTGLLIPGFEIKLDARERLCLRSLRQDVCTPFQVVPCLPFPRSFVVTMTELSHFQIPVPASCLQHVRLALFYWLHACTLHCTAPAALCLKPIAQETQHKLPTIWPAHQVHHGYAPTLAVRQGRLFHCFIVL